MFFVFQIVPPWTIVLLPIPILCLYLLGTAIGLLLLPIGALYQDIGRGIGLVLRFAMYMTPVVFPVPKEDTRTIT